MTDILYDKLVYGRDLTPEQWSKLQYRPVNDEDLYGIVENPSFGIDKSEIGPVVNNRMYYTAHERPESTWITENCSENVFDESTGEGYLLLNPNVTSLTGDDDDGYHTILGDIHDSYENNNITSIVIPSQITSIGDYAFYYYNLLTSVVLPVGLTSIGFVSFAACSNLESINIPNTVTSIGEESFVQCGLTSVVLPNSVTSIGYGAFNSCENLESSTIGNSVTSIGQYAFAGCSNLTSITIPESVITIGNEAFRYCTGLTTINFNAINCTTMGENEEFVFNYCNANAVINIGNNVTIIPDYAFRGIVGSGDLIIPNSVTSIGNYSFFDCGGLTSLSIGNSVESIGERAFAVCNNLTEVNISSLVITSIGSAAFSECENLESFIIPNGITNISYYTFAGCQSLTSIIIPSGVTSIGGGAFKGCSSLGSVTCLATIPPSFVYDPEDPQDVFNNIDTTTLNIPQGTTEAYQNSEWANYFDTFDELTE